MPIKRQDGSFKALNQDFPCTRLHEKEFLPFEQIGYVVDKKPAKKKLEDLALKERYLRTTQSGQYFILIVSKYKTRSIRVEDFLVAKSASSKPPENEKEVIGTRTTFPNPEGQSNEAVKQAQLVILSASF